MKYTKEKINIMPENRFDIEEEELFKQNVFLFNKAIESSLCEIDPVKTIQFVSSFSAFLQTTLDYENLFKGRGNNDVK